MKKITLATVKSFVRKNEGNLYIEVSSSFNGMIDCCDDTLNCDFTPVTKVTWPRPGCPSTYIDSHPILGSHGSGNLLRSYEDDNFIGFNVYNCCGSFNIAVKKVA